MKKYICLLVLVCFETLLFASCFEREDTSQMGNIFFDEYLMDDSVTLESNLTREYDLNDLKSFFEGANVNESSVFESNISALTISKVNDMYPIEILRTSGYSVYRVTQGGYFYVFWIKPFDKVASQSSGEPSVYFSAYLSSTRHPNLFDSLTPGISTAEDVKRIDPFFELSFLMSSGIFSYSYINDETVLQIEYAYPENIEEYADLIIKEKTIVARTDVPTRYSAILSSDLP